MILHWTPDVNGTGGAVTLNVDTLGAAPVKLADGAADPGPLDLTAGRMQEVWYDGSVFRFLNATSPPGILGEIRPACTSSLRGRLWFVAGAVGGKDDLSVCAKDAIGALAWRVLY